MSAVAFLKRATPKMKYQHMRYVMDWKADLKEKQEEFARLKKQIKDRFMDLLADLKLLDPNWEYWYDNVLPDFSGWENAPVYEMQVRVMQLEMRDEQPYLTK